MSDIVAFIRARLDDDEQAASAAPDGPWTAWRGRPGLGLPRGLDYAVTLPGQTAGHIAEIATRSWLAAEHIARQDPARTLRRVVAVRQLVEAHEGEHECSWLTGRGDHGVIDGKPWALFELAHTDDTGGACLVLRCLVAEWSDHPDFDPSWSVTA